MIRKDILWSLSAALFFALWLTLPDFRALFSIILILHLPILVWGVIDLRNNFFCKALCHKKGDTKQLALTFDDGPDPECTPLVLELLDKYGLKATFFLIASKAKQYPDLCKEIIRRGHVIGCHDLTHSYACNFRRSRQMLREIGEAQSAIESACGLKPRFYRPPVGLSNPHLRTALDNLQMQCVGWSSSVGDAGNRRAKTFCNFSLMSRPGSVVLLHDTLPRPELKDSFFTELERLFAQINQDSYSSVTVDTLFSEKPYL